ncbi:hypothetical protein TNCV_2794691 [Trichonephila clavipes]|nr:hypothetical protein TNCV_2794691 [Trichonephila clavipes]
MADRRIFMLGSRSLLLDKRRQASRWSFEAGILTSRKVYSEESEWKSESSYWLMKSDDNGCPCGGELSRPLGGAPHSLRNTAIENIRKRGLDAERLCREALYNLNQVDNKEMGWYESANLAFLPSFRIGKITASFQTEGKARFFNVINNFVRQYGVEVGSRVSGGESIYSTVNMIVRVDVSVMISVFRKIIFKGISE